MTDTSNWMVSERKLLRGGFIAKDTPIMISFAYLFRIQIGGEYLLVKNGQGIGKFQPVGGVYKMSDQELLYLKNKFEVCGDNKTNKRVFEKQDYRLRFQAKHLKKFVKRFDSELSERERLDDLSREFTEELVKEGIVEWQEISYRYCGRHFTDICFSKHFQIYELLMADIVELIPTPEQLADLQHLKDECTENSIYRFATAAQIQSCGVDTSKGLLQDWITNHTEKILEETEPKLIKSDDVGNVYKVSVSPV